jgi:hypothetical protein
MGRVPRLGEREAEELGARLVSELAVLSIAFAVLGNEVGSNCLMLSSFCHLDNKKNCRVCLAVF